MEKRYRKLGRLPRHQYLPGAPVVLQTGMLFEDIQTGNPVLRLKMRNLSDCGILEMKVRIQAAGQWVDYHYDDLAANTDEVLCQNQGIPLPPGQWQECSVTVTEVVFAGGGVWQNQEPFAPLPPQQPMEQLLQDEALLEQYRRETTPRARYLPAIHKGLWQCTCGGLNSALTPKCVHCGVSLEELKQITSRKDLKLQKRRYERRKRNFLRQNHERRRWTAFLLAGLVVLLAVLLFASKWQRQRVETQLEPYRNSAFAQYKTMLCRDTGFVEGVDVSFSVEYQSQVVKNGRYCIQGTFCCDLGEVVSHLPFTVTGQLGEQEQEMSFGDDYLTDDAGNLLQ